MRIRLEGRSPPSAPRRILPPSVARYYFDIGCAVWVFLRYAVTGALRDDTETRRAVPREKGGGGGGEEGEGDITTSRIVISRRECTPTRHQPPSDFAIRPVLFSPDSDLYLFLSDRLNRVPREDRSRESGRAHAR